MRIAIQGEFGSFHHEAAMRLEPDADVVPEKHFAAVFQAVLHNEVEYGLCAIENSLYGSINEVYRLLERHDVWIVRDIRIHISQHLIGPKAVSLEELAGASTTRVLSQSPALAQVELWLDAHLPNATREEIGDTALGVREVVRHGNPYAVAVAGAFAAKTHGGVVIAKDIQDEPDNYTRFVLFSKIRNDVPDATHASVIIKTNHAPGALLRVLQVFADHGCNLTKLDSHPMPANQRQYAFYIDYELAERSVSTAIIAELRRQRCSVKLLGEYSSMQ